MIWALNQLHFLTLAICRVSCGSKTVWTPNMVKMVGFLGYTHICTVEININQRKNVGPLVPNFDPRSNAPHGAAPCDPWPRPWITVANFMQSFNGRAIIIYHIIHNKYKPVDSGNIQKIARYICLYIYIRVRTCICMCIRVYVNVYIYICKCTCKCIRICICICVCVCKCISICKCTCTCTCICICIYIYICMYVCMYVCMYMYLFSICFLPFMEWTCFPNQDCRPQGTSEQVAQPWPQGIDSLIPSENEPSCVVLGCFPSTRSREWVWNSQEIQRSGFRQNLQPTVYVYKTRRLPWIFQTHLGKSSRREFHNKIEFSCKFTLKTIQTPFFHWEIFGPIRV